MPGSRRTVDSDLAVTRFSPCNPPAAKVVPGERLRIRVRDAYDGFFVRRRDIGAYLAARRPERMNPVTGPLWVEGAAPGDVLAVTIEAIALDRTGWVAATPATGLAGAVAVQPAVSEFLVRDDGLWLDGELRLPLRPMVGTIGVAPADRSEIALELGEYGGNLDLNEITAGATVYLPVQVEGALLALGDVHAAMGYGEAHSGVNTPASVDLTLELLKNPPHRGIWIESETELATVGVAADLATALARATAAMEAQLIERLALAPARARMISGSTLDLRLGQAGGYGVNVSALAAVPRQIL
jgi:amidase